MSGSARSYLLRLLKLRLRSRAELSAALQKRQVPAAEVEELLDELTAVGLIDDLRFAGAWVRSRDRLKPIGWPLLERELRLKGISPEIIARVKADRVQTEEPVDEDEQIRNLIKKKERLYANLSAETKKRRLIAFLLRRGFALERVWRILNA